MGKKLLIGHPSTLAMRERNSARILLGRRRKGAQIDYMRVRLHLELAGHNLRSIWLQPAAMFSSTAEGLVGSTFAWG